MNVSGRLLATLLSLWLIAAPAANAEQVSGCDFTRSDAAAAAAGGSGENADVAEQVNPVAWEFLQGVSLPANAKFQDYE